jgi:hypothetical protein
MRVDLRQAQDNSCRDFTIDPIDDAIVDALFKSIEEHGFWLGIVLCMRNGVIYIVAGHHRVRAALKAGYTIVDLPVGKYDDATMIRIYARENATQRGGTGTALAGSVASALRYLTKRLLTGGDLSLKLDNADDDDRDDNLGQIQPRLSSRAIEVALGNLKSGDGIGWRWVHAFLSDVPGINESSIKQQTANFKASGDYKRIIGEIESEIAREAEEAEAEREAAAERARLAQEEEERLEAEEAERQAAKKAQELEEASETAQEAATNAGKHERVFDLAGVQRHLTVPYHVECFRKAVIKLTDISVPVDKQAELAAMLVTYARDNNWEFTGNFIKDYISVKAQEVMGRIRVESLEEKRRRLERDILLQIKTHQEEFVRHMSHILRVGVDIRDWLRKHPKIDFPVQLEFRDVVTDARDIINELAEEFGHGDKDPKRPSRKSKAQSQNNRPPKALGHAP